MHNSMCFWKLTCLLCACDRDFQSNYRRRSSKKTNVSFNKTEHKMHNSMCGPVRLETYMQIGRASCRERVCQYV